MTDIAIVASKRDAQFAEAVRASLQASGHDVSVTEILPKQSVARVVLIWSAALEAAHAIDAQALIGLWSESRLLVARRDATPLPLGLRDLPSLPPSTSSDDVCAAVTGAVQSEVRERGSPVAKLLAALVIAGIALASWYYYTAAERARSATLTAAFEAMSKATEELNQAKMAELGAQKRASEARAAEDAARKSGDAAALQAATAARVRAEADAAAQNNLVQQREAGVAATRKAAVDAKKVKDDTDKRAAADEPKGVEKPQVAAVAPKAEPKAEPVAKAAPKAEAPKATSRAERERLSDEEAARKALAAGSAPAQVASAAPGAAPAAKAQVDSETLYQQALAMESAGNAQDAVRIYRRAARAGSGKAAKRLGEIFDRGVPGVSRDYAESLQWYETARQLGETVETAGTRGGGFPAKSREAAEPTYAIIIGLLMLVALAVILWLRSRRSRAREAPQPQAAHPGPQAPADAATLFVCYSHRDRQRVEPIVSLIEAMGRRVWMDRTGITGQTGWAGQIVRAIRECRAVVLMASPNSYSSDQVVRELYLAMNHKKPIVPIEIEPADLPDELQYILAPFQHHRLSGRETRDVLGRALAAV